MLPVEKLNRFLKGHTFTMKNVFRERFSIEGDLNFKIEIDKVDELSDTIFLYIKVYCLPSSKQVEQLMELFFSHLGDSKTINYKESSKPSERTISFLTYPISDLVAEFLKYFSIDNVFVRDVLYINQMTNQTIS